MRAARRGNVAVIIALSLTVLLAFAAVVIDVGYGRLVHRQLQDAADAAALAAAARLDGTDDGLEEARATAEWIASENRAAGAPVAIDGATDVVLGDWDKDAGSFTESDDPEVVDAVQVSARIDALRLFIAPVALDRESIPVSARARVFVDHGGAGSAECFIPIGMPACLVDRYTLDGLQNVTLKLNPPGIDNVGYARPGATPNASWTRSQIGNCTSSGEIEIGDTLGLQNGVVTSALAEFVPAIVNSTTRWDTSKWGALPARDSRSSIPVASYGKTYEGIVPVFDGGASYCSGSGGTFNGTAAITGFVWGAIYEVINSGRAENRTLKMRLDFTRSYDEGTGTGGPDWGVTADEPPRMIPAG
jgi:hypothetical protein